ncbi:MAG: UDP-3-O-(3-hydroxymyristoyl)glucosamine N-acyltransferase [Kiritimatiellae bacterium]|nr:UDP-3-O-(3-hydroxymyristoyl)glucosamine N-acyltransferase [Kiritimatiellia bacterium]
MGLTVKEIAAEISAVVVGDETVMVSGVASLKAATSTEISFLSSAKYAYQVAESNAAAIMVAEDFDGDAAGSVLLKVKDPDYACSIVAPLLNPPMPTFEPGIHPAAVIAEDAQIGENVYIGPCCVVEQGASIGDSSVLVANVYIGHGSSLGEDCKIYANVSVREYVTIGSRTIIHSGTVVGSDGFGYTNDKGKWIKIPQVGTVEVGNDVEFGSNVSIDRARFGKTVIADGVKIDNLVQIAHNVEVGQDTAMAAQVGIAGSAKIGRNVMLGGQVGLAGHIEIGNGVVILAKSGVHNDVPDGEVIFGAPAMPAKTALKVFAILPTLPDMRKQIKTLTKQLKALENKLEE